MATDDLEEGRTLMATDVGLGPPETQGLGTGTKRGHAMRICARSIIILSIVAAPAFAQAPADQKVPAKAIDAKQLSYQSPSQEFAYKPSRHAPDGARDGKGPIGRKSTSACGRVL